MDAVLLTSLADAGGTRVVEARQGVVGRVELYIDVADVVSRRPCDRLLDPETASDIDPDPVPQLHFIAPLSLGSNQFSRNQLGDHLCFRRQSSLQVPASRPLTCRTRRC